MPKQKLTDEQKTEIKIKAMNGVKLVNMAKEYDVHKSTITYICKSIKDFENYKKLNTLVSKFEQDLRKLSSQLMHSTDFIKIEEKLQCAIKDLNEVSSFLKPKDNIGSL